MKKIATSIFLFVALVAAAIAQETDVPYLTGRVTDMAQILSRETKESLSDSLRAHEMRTTNQVAVLTIPTLNGESIEDYANRVFNEWKLGQKGKDNGILVVVAPDDRRMRIEVGYGLEGTLTDLMSGRIIRNIMTPKFKNDDYDGGIRDGALAVISILEGAGSEQVAGMDEDPAAAEKSDFFSQDTGLTIMERILIGGFIFGIIGLFTLIGIVTPGMGWFLYLFLIPFWAMFPMVVLGTKGAFVCFILYLVGYPATKIFLGRTSWYKKAKQDIRTKGSASIGGFTFSSGGSGSSWSSGSGGSSRSSGFSGGGGRSGGGGSSGGW
jgi:uncharacterized protein